MRNIFLKKSYTKCDEETIPRIFSKKSYTKCDEETIPRTFSKKSKLSIYLDQESEVLYRLLLSRKFYIRRNNSKVDSIETGSIVTAHYFPEVI